RSQPSWHFSARLAFWFLSSGSLDFRCQPALEWSCPIRPTFSACFLFILLSSHSRFGGSFFFQAKKSPHNFLQTQPQKLRPPQRNQPAHRPSLSSPGSCSPPEHLVSSPGRSSSPKFPPCSSPTFSPCKPSNGSGPSTLSSFSLAESAC